LGVLFGCLYAFGDDLHTEFVSERDDRRHDGATRPVSGQVGDESLVDLDDVDREPLEVAER
jgi:hypothetical protein